MRLIDLDDERHTYVGDDGEYERWNIDPDAPTIDAVQVVRCEDCKHRHPYNNVWTCVFGLPSGPDGYCSYGERKEE